MIRLLRVSSGKCRGVEFKADVLLLPLSGSDVVLAVHWFS